MAMFFGKVVGEAKTAATRLGDKDSGLTVTAASGTGAIEVSMKEKKPGVIAYTVTVREWPADKHVALITRGELRADTVKNWFEEKGE